MKTEKELLEKYHSLDDENSRHSDYMEDHKLAIDANELEMHNCLTELCKTNPEAAIKLGMERKDAIEIYEFNNNNNNNEY